MNAAIQSGIDFDTQSSLPSNHAEHDLDVSPFCLPAPAANRISLLGRVEAPVGTHTVVVTDCYRTNLAAARRRPRRWYHYALPRRRYLIRAGR